MVPPLEREEDWQDHLAGIQASLAPSGHFESCLAERIALLLWRLRRVVAFETETLLSDLRDLDNAWFKEEEASEELSKIPFYGEAARWAPLKEQWLQRRRADLIIPHGPALERVTRYEAHLQRQLLQTMHELEALQQRRNGGPAPLARLDIQGWPQS